MPDPLQQTTDDDLFSLPMPKKDTVRLAGEVAATVAGKRRQQILQLLAQRPMALWQMAEHLGLHDNQISGRVTDLKRDGLIEPTGERIARPGSTATAEIYRRVTPPALPL